MSMHGKVTVWRMTEEERLAYIKKHPIVATDKPTGSTFTEINQMQNKREERRKQAGERAVDRVDKEKAHKLFMADSTLKNMAKELCVSQTTLNAFIKEQRQLDPEKWPHRIPGRKK